MNPMHVNRAIEEYIVKLKSLLVFSGITKYGTIFGVLATLGNFVVHFSIQTDCLLWASEARSPIGDVVTASGTVKARAANGSNSRDIRSGDRVYLNDVINTGSDGRLKLLMNDKTILDLGPSSLFEIEKYKSGNNKGERQVQVSLPYGKLRSAVTEKLKGEGQFKVRTSTATMGVRGTEFVVKSDSPTTENPSNSGSSGTTEVTVLAGEVGLQKSDQNNASGSDSTRDPASTGASTESLTLAAGTQMTVGTSDSGTAGESEKPQQISAAEMREISSESTVSDSTFSDKVTIADSATQEKKQDESSAGEKSGSSSDGSSRDPAGESESGGAFATLSAMVSDAPMVQEISVSDLDIPGSFDLSEDSSEITQTAPTTGVGARISITVQ